jgi:hypothetical protein
MRLGHLRPGQPRTSGGFLRTHFRSTCPIHDLAEKYREPCSPDVEGEPVTTQAFRDGSSPELYRASIREEILKLHGR